MAWHGNIRTECLHSESVKLLVRDFLTGDHGAALYMPQDGCPEVCAVSGPEVSAKEKERQQGCVCCIQ